DRRICHSRRVHCRASRPAAEGSLNLDSDDLRIVGWVPQPLYSEVTEVEQVRLDGFFIDRAQQSSAERTHHVRTDRICVTQYKGVSAADVITLAEREPGLAVVIARSVQAREFIPAEQRVFVTSLVVDPANGHRVVRIAFAPEQHFSARIG